MIIRSVNVVEIGRYSKILNKNEIRNPVSQSKNLGPLDDWEIEMPLFLNEIGKQMAKLEALENHYCPIALNLY